MPSEKHQCIFRSRLETPADEMECECGEIEKLENLEKPSVSGHPYVRKTKPKGSDK